jgi:photosystem II stability/assembly factor-like uncharacterized protein
MQLATTEVQAMTVATSVLNLQLLTWSGIVNCRFRAGAAQVDVLGTNLEGENIRSVVADSTNPRQLYACSVSDVYSSADGGETWTWLPSGGVDYREIWTLAAHPLRSGEVYVGTSPAMVYVSENGGRSFRELPGFRDLPYYKRWTFPPAPHAPDIRSIVLDARVPDEVVVGVEEGGVVRSFDRGLTWHDASGPADETAFPMENDPSGLKPYQPVDNIEGRVYRDVHNVLRDPSSLDRLYAATGYGVFRTDDGGKWWRRLEYGMERGYAVPMAVHPERANRLFLGAAFHGPTAWKGPRAARTGPFTASRYSRDMLAQTGGALAEVLRSEDFGDTWSRLQNGLPTASPSMISGVDINPLDPDMVFVTYTDGSLYTSDDAGDSWRQVLSGVDRLFGVRVLEA